MESGSAEAARFPVVREGPRDNAGNGAAVVKPGRRRIVQDQAEDRAVLDRADPALRQEGESLLARENGAGFLEAPALERRRRAMKIDHRQGTLAEFAALTQHVFLENTVLERTTCRYGLIARPSGFRPMTTATILEPDKIHRARH